jgi:MraZ protein
MFLGEYQHIIDDKGRLAIPAKFRPLLEDGLVVTRSLDPCLYVWTRDQWGEMADKLAALSILQADARRVNRHFSSGATAANLDKLGRVLIPQFLRDYAGLKDDVVVLGSNRRIEIWARDRWEVEQQLTDEQSADFGEHLSALGVQI